MEIINNEKKQINYIEKIEEFNFDEDGNFIVDSGDDNEKIIISAVKLVQQVKILNP